MLFNCYWELPVLRDLEISKLDRGIRVLPVESRPSLDRPIAMQPGRFSTSSNFSMQEQHDIAIGISERCASLKPRYLPHRAAFTAVKPDMEALSCAYDFDSPSIRWSAVPLAALPLSGASPRSSRSSDLSSYLSRPPSCNCRATSSSSPRSGAGGMYGLVSGSWWRNVAAGGVYGMPAGWMGWNEPGGRPPLALGWMGIRPAGGGAVESK